MWRSSNSDLRRSCRCSSHIQDVIIQPCVRRGHFRPAAPIRDPTRVSSSGEAPQFDSTDTRGAGAPLPQAQRTPVWKNASAVPKHQANSPGYAVVPERGDIPPAVNQPLYPKKTKSPQHIKPGTRDIESQTTSRGANKIVQRKQQAQRDGQPTQQAAIGPPQPSQLQHAVPERRRQQLQRTDLRLVSRPEGAEPQPQAVGGPLQPQRQQAELKQQPQHSRQQLLGKPNSRRHSDPGKAFMRAGMPSGLWVLPLDAKSEEPPAPPPVAPDDPQQLLQVLQNMPPPRRKLVIFKAGGYIFSDMEALIQDSGLSHVIRLTNLIRKANCVLAKPVWDNGRRINLRQHQAAAEKAKIPFLLIKKLDPVELVAAVRPLLIKRKTLVEQQQQQHGMLLQEGQEQQQQVQQSSTCHGNRMH